MNLRDYLRLIRRRWAVLVLASLLGVGITAGWLSTQTLKYTATSATYISVSAASDVAAASAGASYAQVAAKNFATIATSPYVLRRVDSDLHLSGGPQQLATQVEATALLNTSVISISATADSPAAAAAIANTVAVELADSLARLNPNVGNAASLTLATQITHAVPPGRPSSPQIPLDLALGLLAGLALAVVVVVARDAVDTRLYRSEQLSEITSAPLLGVLPDVKRIAWSSPPSQRLPSQTVDAYRALRTKLQYSSASHSWVRALVVASPDEPLTTAHAVAQLAESFAQAGERVLVIDAQPSAQWLSTYFGVESSVGLADALVTNSGIENVVQASSAPNIWVMNAGRIDQEFSEQIRSERMPVLLRELQRLFGMILIAPDPLLASQDGAVLARLTSGALLVCRSAHTTSSDAQKAIGVLDGVGADKVGVALVVPDTARASGPPSGKRRHRTVMLEASAAAPAA